MVTAKRQSYTQFIHNSHKLSTGYPQVIHTGGVTYAQVIHSLSTGFPQVIYTVIHRIFTVETTITEPFKGPVRGLAQRPPVTEATV